MSGYNSYGGYGGEPPATEPGPGSDNDRSMGMLANLSPLIAMVLTVNVASLIAPWVMWVIYKERSPFVRRCAAQTFNFDITMWIVALVGWAMVLTVILSPIGFLVIFASGIAQIIFHILGALSANRGVVYEYPMQFFRILN